MHTASKSKISHALPMLDDRYTLTTIRPGGVVERRERIGSLPLTYVLRGPREAVKARVDAIFADYPPAGYGTTAALLSSQDGGDEVVVRVIHASSCD